MTNEKTQSVILKQHVPLHALLLICHLINDLYL